MALKRCQFVDGVLLRLTAEDNNSRAPASRSSRHASTG